MPGGRRGLNEALKTAWREQLKQNNRTTADKIIIAMTTGMTIFSLVTILYKHRGLNLNYHLMCQLFHPGRMISNKIYFPG